MFALFAASLAIASPTTTVGVVPFGTMSAPEYASLGTGMALALEASIAAEPKLGLVSPPEIAQVLRRRDITAETVTRGSLVAELARVLGADYLVTGTFGARWPDLQITLRIVDGRDGRVAVEVWDLVHLEDALPTLADLTARAFKQ